MQAFAGKACDRTRPPSHTSKLDKVYNKSHTLPIVAVSNNNSAVFAVELRHFAGLHKYGKKLLHANVRLTIPRSARGAIS